MNMRKVLALVLCLMLVVTAFAACSNGDGSSQSQPQNNDNSQSQSQQEKPEYYKVAYMGPLTGNYAQYGSVHSKTLQMAMDEINEAGGINGVPMKVELFDEKNDAKETVTVANKIVNDPEILACFGPFSSTCAMAAAPIFGKAKMTLMAPATSHPDFPTLNDYMVSGQATMEWEQENFAKFVYNDLGLRKVAHLYQNSDSTLTTDKFFTQFFEELGGEVIAHEMFIPGQTQDFSTFLSKIKEAEPELLYIGAAYSDCANIVKQAHNLDINIPMMANASNMKEEFLDIGGDDVEGFLFVSSLDPSYQGEKFVQFKKNFEEKVASVVDPQSLQMYDLANMFCTALKEYGPDREKINEYMRNVQGYEGVNATINMVNGSPKKPMGPVTIKNGEFVTYTGE